MERSHAERYEFFATCAMGLEKIVAGELAALKVRQIRPLASGVSFQATFKQACEALLWLRCASRLQLVLGRVDAKDADELYAGCMSIPWHEHIAAGSTISVYVKGTNSNLRNTVFTSMKVKDAVCDQMVAKTGSRPDVDTKNPDVGIRVNLHDKKASIYLDFSGGPMHIRGYREAGVQVQAPIKETLAAAILMAGNWQEICKMDDVAFIDPFCGSGTLAIEAAMIAGDIAPGIQRGHWGIQGWKQFDDRIFDDVLAAADDRMEAGLEKIPPIYANDLDRRAIGIARDCAKRAGIQDKITFIQEDIANLQIEGLPENGLLATNPPYGERLLSQNQIASMEIALKRFISSSCKGFSSAVICADDSIDGVFGAHPQKTIFTKNGPIDASIRCYAPFEGAGDDESDASAEAEQFANRLAKMAKHRGKWARRNGVSCYRVYDADLAEFNIAIDIYEGAARETGKKWIHVSEYAAPKSVDSVVAARRLELAIGAIQKQFGVGAGDIYLKRRVKSKGGSQYAGDASGEPADFNYASGFHTVSEGGHLFKVKFDGALDTGLFLDTRMIRALIEEQAAGKSFLNLFAYTGSASVYAAAGKAKSTCTVDLSQRYLDWAKENMTINGYGNARHIYRRADVISWISDARHSNEKYDLIYVDPPTFSNSKKMRGKSFDIQRDHVELLIGVSRILARGGQAIFCCNLRNFKPDVEALAKAKVKIEDISSRTMPADFERNSKIHHCYIVTRA